MKRICIVDDDAGIRESLRFLFEDTDYALEEVTDGIEALELLQRDHAPRVLLLDRMMPRLDGAGVLRALATAPETQDRTAVVFSTARSDPPDDALANLIAANTFATVTKPFHIDDLLAAVERAWETLTRKGGRRGSDA